MTDWEVGRMAGKSVRLFTRQNDKTLYQLERDHRVINVRRYVELHFGDIAPLFLESYDWFTRMAAKMVPKPDDVQAPIWCAIRREDCMPPIPGTVVYELEVPEEEVIYFSDLRWDYVLNRIYLPKDEEDAAAYQKHLAELGVVNGFEFFEGRYKGLFPEEVRKIQQSWKRVFEVPSLEEAGICGNIWEIRKECVKRIVRPGEKV